jgi:hypothetical protein
MYRIEDLQQGETIIKYNFGDMNTEIDAAAAEGAHHMV